MKRQVVIFALIFLLSACTAKGMPIAGVTETPTSTISFPTLTATVAPFPSPTLRMPTALPAVSPDNVQEVLTTLTQQNGGCQLPCLMGLVPGYSDRTAATMFVRYLSANPFSDMNIYVNQENIRGGALYTLRQDNVYVSVGIAYYLRGDIIDQLTFTADAYHITDNGDIGKVFGHPYFYEILGGFSLLNILTAYGTPNQVLIRAYPDDYGHPSPPAQYPFSVVLFYPEQGFLVEYISVRNEQNGNYVGCPNESYALQISGWAPGSSVSLEDAVQHFSNYDGITFANYYVYQPIENVTTVDLAQFYEKFTLPGSDECVETPVGLWPPSEP